MQIAFHHQNVPVPHSLPSIGYHHFNLTLLKSWRAEYGAGCISTNWVKVGTSCWPCVGLREGSQSPPILYRTPSWRRKHLSQNWLDIGIAYRKWGVRDSSQQEQRHNPCQGSAVRGPSRCSRTHSSIPWKSPLWMSAIPAGYWCLNCTNQWKLFPSLPCRSQRQQPG